MEKEVIIFTDTVKKIRAFFKNETVLCISAILAIISMIIVPPYAGYADYIDFSVIIMLFCLMAVIAGFTETGIFKVISDKMLSTTDNSRKISLILVNLCFFTAMLVTNDVALITFVPLTISIFRKLQPKQLILIIVAETAAANLGSMLTPIGNPQNLYLYSHYNIPIGEFIMIMLPLAVVSLLLVNAMCIAVKPSKISVEGSSEKTIISKKSLIVLSIVFVICLLTVLHVVNNIVCLAAVIAGIALIDIKILKKVDYYLLGTFMCFFIFVGNIGSIQAVRDAVSGFLEGRELIAALLLSQIISNLPSAMMLSDFTDNAKAILRGVDIGGLGTLIASLASLISFKFYSRTPDAKNFTYLVMFTVVSIVFLAILIPVAMLF